MQTLGVLRSGNHGRLGALPAPAQRMIQPPVFQEALDVVDAGVTIALHVLVAESGSPVGVMELLRTLAGRPLRAKAGQRTADLVTIDPVATLVRTATWSVFDTATRNNI